MSLYIGEDKNKSWEDLRLSIERLDDTWESAKLIAFSIGVCSKGDSHYTEWLAKCALHLASRVAQVKKERDAAIRRFETYAKNDSHWGIENSIMKDALELIIRAVPINKDAKLACEGLKVIAREAIKEIEGK